VRGREPERVLGVVGDLRVAGRDGPLPHALDEGKRRGVSAEEARKGVGVGPAGGWIGELRPEELQQLFGRARHEPVHGVGQDIRALAVG
jgi:hypothetical protein